MPVPRSSLSTAALTAVLLAAGFLALPDAGAALTLTFTETEVVVSGLTPGGQVALTGVAYAPLQWTAVVQTHALVFQDIGGDGTEAYAVRGGIRPTSVWAAVDLPSGAYAVGIPAEGPVRPFAGIVGLGPGGELKVAPEDTSVQCLRGLHLLHVRSGTGAWKAEVTDGGQRDLDGSTNCTQLISVGYFTALSENTLTLSPSSFLPGDIVIGIETHSFTYFATRLGDKEEP